MQLTCPSCESVLEVDDAAALAIDCPVCDARLAINPAAPASPKPQPPARPGWDCAVCGTTNAAADRECEFCLSPRRRMPAATKPRNAEPRTAPPLDLSQPTTVRLGEVLSQTMRLLSRNAGPLLAISLVEILLLLAFWIPPLVMFVAVAAWVGGNAGPGQGFLLIATALLTVATMWIAYQAQHAGHYVVMFKVVRGERVSVSDLFGHSHRSAKLVALSFPFVAFVTLGFAAFLIPGLIVWMLLWPYGRIVVDRNPPGMQALSLAGELMRRNFGNMLAICFVLNGLMLLLAAVPMLAIITTPFASLGLTVAYFRMTGEKTILDRERDARLKLLEGDMTAGRIARERGLSIADV